MRWVFIQHGYVVHIGDYESTLDAAERYGCIEHQIQFKNEEGELKRATVRGRGFYRDGTEISPRIVGAIMVPERMLSASVRRRAA